MKTARNQPRPSVRWLLCCCERRKWAAGSKDRIVQRPSFILFSARATAAARGAAAAHRAMWLATASFD
jgi:hypothetical protein